MKPAAFHYHAPDTVDEAITLLGQVASLDGRLLAGGQSLVPTMAFRMARPAHLIDINGIAGLDKLGMADGKLSIVPEVFADAAEAAAATVDPMEDLQANAKYRRDLVRAVVRRALERAAA